MVGDIFDILQDKSQEFEAYNNERSQVLKKRLEELPTGKEDKDDGGQEVHRQYEILIEEIVDYLFETDLGPPKTQLSTKDNLHRFDIVARINDECSSFWKFVAESLGSRYIIIECKNHTNEIKQGDILTTEKYLFNKALRRFALIFTRKGADKNANKMIDAIIREEGKFLLVLKDEDVIKLLDDPSNKDTYLLDLMDNLLMKLSR